MLNQSILNNMLSKIVIRLCVLSAFCLIFASCSFSSTSKAQNNNEPNNYNSEEFPPNNMGGAITITNDSTKKFQSDTFKINSGCVIKYIDLKHLKNNIDSSKQNTLIHFWTTMDSGKTDFSKWIEIKKLNNFNTIIISVDIGSSDQIDLLRRYLTAKGFIDTSYIIYEKYENGWAAFSEMKSHKKLMSFIHSIDTFYNKIQIPYTIAINKNNEVVYRKSGEIDIKEIAELNEKINKQNLPSLGLAFKGSKDSDTFEKSEDKEDIEKLKEEISQYLSFAGGINTDEFKNVVIPDSICKATILTTKDLKNILRQNKGKKILMHIWGIWCPTTALGILDIKKLIPTDSSYRLLLISADMKTDAQIDLIRKYLYKNGINIPIYIIDNEFKSIDDMPKFAKFKHVIKFINVFDKDYDQTALPYTAILDENRNIIYKRVLEVQVEDLSPVEIETLNDEVNKKYGTMEVDKIKEILEQR